MAPTGTPPAVTRGRRAHLVGFAAAAAVFLALLIGRATFVVDDAYISFRYARNWAEWGVPAYNPGEDPPVEGYSCFLWVALLRLAHGIGLPLRATALVLGALAGLGTLAVLHRVLARRLALGALPASLGLLLLATSPPFVVWSSSGMETALFGLLVLGAFAALLREGGGRGAGVAAGLASLGVALVRVEGFAWVLAIAGSVALAQLGRSHGLAGRRRTRHLWNLGIYLVGFAVYLLWRHAVHDAWLANTAYAKSGLSWEGVLRGLRYVASWAVVVVAPVVALGFAPLALRGGRPRPVAAALLLLAAFAGYTTLVGGDWMPFFHFLAPAAPLCALVLAAGLARLPRAAAVGVAAAVAAAQLAPLLGAHLAPASLREALYFRAFRGGYQTEWERVEVARRNEEHFTILGRALAQHRPEGDSLVFGAIGAVGWHSGWTLHDRNGLVDREIARRAVDLGSGTAGHEKRVPFSWFLDRGADRPTYFYAVLVSVPFGPPGSRERAAGVAAVMRARVLSLGGEEPLLDGTLPEIVPLEEEEGIPSGLTLFLLRGAPADEARAYWRRLGF